LSSSKELRTNNHIRVREVLLIDENGEKIGVVTIQEALKRASDANLDLVEISPNAAPPVCKILDYGKYKFELERKAKESKKNQQVTKLKELRLQPIIDKHDYDFKLAHAKEFLEDLNKVKITIRFRGRQMAHINIGEDVLNRFIEDLKDYGTVDKRPTLEGKSMNIIFSPLGKKSSN